VRPGVDGGGLRPGRRVAHGLIVIDSGELTEMKRTLWTALGAVLVAGAGIVGFAQPASAAPEVCQTTVSDNAEILVCTQLAASSTRPGYVLGYGRAIELHEYLRQIQVVATVERQSTAGQWEVIASAESWDREGTFVATPERPGTGILRACATGGIRGHEQTKVCTDQAHVRGFSAAA
jgi:hypothetical protein